MSEKSEIKRRIRRGVPGDFNPDAADVVKEVRELRDEDNKRLDRLAASSGDGSTAVAPSAEASSSCDTSSSSSSDCSF